MLKSTFVVLALLLSGIACASDVATVDGASLLKRVQSGDSTLVVLDVRTPQEFAEGHVPGAVNIPHDTLESRLAELEADRDKDVVVYCRSGRRAGMALTVLEKAGFERLSHLEGDYLAWSAAELPVETIAEPAPQL